MHEKQAPVCTQKVHYPNKLLCVHGLEQTASCSTKQQQLFRLWRTSKQNFSSASRNPIDISARYPTVENGSEHNRPRGHRGDIACTALCKANEEGFRSYLRRGDFSPVRRRRRRLSNPEKRQRRGPCYRRGAIGGHWGRADGSDAPRDSAARSTTGTPGRRGSRAGAPAATAGKYPRQGGPLRTRAIPRIPEDVADGVSERERESEGVKCTRRDPFRYNIYIYRLRPCLFIFPVQLAFAITFSSHWHVKNLTFNLSLLRLLW